MAQQRLQKQRTVMLQDFEGFPDHAFLLSRGRPVQDGQKGLVDELLLLQPGHSPGHRLRTFTAQPAVGQRQGLRL